MKSVALVDQYGKPLTGSGVLNVQLTGSNATDTESGSNVPVEGLMVYNGYTWDRIRGANGWGDANTGQGFAVTSPRLFNGSYYDRQYNNTQGTLLASAARTASVSSPTTVNYNGRGVKLKLNISAASGAGGLFVYLYEVGADGAAYCLNAGGTNITATGVYSFEFYPGIMTTDGGNVVQRTSTPVGRQYYARVNAADNSSYTYSLCYEHIL